MKKDLFEHLHKSGIRKEEKKKVSDLFEESDHYINKVYNSAQLLSQKHTNGEKVSQLKDVILVFISSIEGTFLPSKLSRLRMLLTLALLALRLTVYLKVPLPSEFKEISSIISALHYKILEIMWHIMKIFQSHGYNEFIICLGYKGEKIKSYFKNRPEIIVL